jgi:hypothetical protein
VRFVDLLKPGSRCRTRQGCAKPAVPLSWVERVKPSTSTLIQTRVPVSPDCFPSSRPGRDRERGTAMIYAGRFIPYRDRWCAADRRQSDGHPVPQGINGRRGGAPRPALACFSPERS